LTDSTFQQIVTDIGYFLMFVLPAEADISQEA